MSSDWSKKTSLRSHNSSLIDGYGILTLSAWAFHNKFKNIILAILYSYLPLWSIGGGV